MWGLALSLGGVRRATFGLSVLQALSKAGAEPMGIDSGNATGLAPAYRLAGYWPILARID